MVEAAEFRGGMALLAGAVNVVTTDGPMGRAGLTASAVCSVTDQPPTLLVCVNRASYAHSFFMGNNVLCVNVLSSSQQSVSALFATRTATMDERFASIGWDTLATGAPALEGALASFDGKIVQAHEMGTHDIFLVELSAVRITTDRDPGALAYFNRAYHRIGEERTSTALAPDNVEPKSV
ncbi:pyrimidine utilization flavin reductase protein F [soil metagenome]